MTLPSRLPPIEPDTTQKSDNPFDIAECSGRFRQLTETVTVQVWIADHTGRFVIANREAANFFSHDPGRSGSHKGWLGFLHPDDAERVNTEWQDAIGSRHPFESEFRLRRQDGAYRWFLGRAQAVYRKDGTIDRWFETNTDVDDLKTRQLRAEENLEAKDNFLAVLSHELRTPLTPAVIATSAIAEDLRLPSDLRARLKLAQDQLALATRLIDDVFDHSALAHGRLQLRKESCDLHGLIDQVLETLRDDFQSKPCAVERRYHARHCRVEVDPVRVQQVIWNILRNAAKFTPAHGRIRIATANVGAAGADSAERIEIAFSDSGVGLPPEMLERIFLPYEQADRNTSRTVRGLGLGLSIARTLAILHGGTIVAQSDGPGKGATFIVDLPIQTGVLPVQPPPSPTPDIFRSLRILLVEDHVPTLQVLRDLLRLDGHTVATAATVADALLAADKTTYDLLISDVGLPDGTGYDLMSSLQKSRGLRGIALTGYGMDADLHQSQAAGFEAHLTKPVQIGRLRELIQSFA